MPIIEPLCLQQRRAFSAAALSAFCLVSSQAFAADPSATDGTTPAAVEPSFSRFDYISEKFAEWKVVVGAGAQVAPKFEGSDKFKIMPFPLVRAQFGNRVSLDTGGLAIDVFKLENFTFGARGGYDLGRDEDDSNHLEGLGDVDAGGVVGAFAAYKLGPVTFKAALDRTIGGSEGLVGTFGAEVQQMFGRFILAAGASGAWADDNHMESYFSVTRRQSERSGLSRYRAEAGIKRVDLEASVTYLATEHWLVRGQAGVGYLVGDAADSPIVQEKFQPSGLLAVGYRF